MSTSGIGGNLRLNGSSPTQLNLSHLRCLLYLNNQGIIQSSIGNTLGLLGEEYVEGYHLFDFLKVTEDGEQNAISRHLRESLTSPHQFTAYPKKRPQGTIPLLVTISYQGSDVFLTEVKSATHETLTHFSAQQSSILEKVATGKPLEAVLLQLIKLIESVLPDSTGSILLLGPDKIHISHSFAPSMPTYYNSALLGQSIRPNFGTCGTAMYSQKRIITEDLTKEPAWQNYLQLVLPLGLKACWSTPIISAEHQVLGTFGIYYRECRAPLEFETAILDSASHMAAVAIVHHLNQSKIQNTLSYQTHLLDNFPALVWKTNHEGRPEYFNRHWLRFTGRTLEAELKEGWLSSIHPADKDHVLAQYIMAHESRRPFEIRYRFLRFDGVYRWLEDHGAPMTDLDGKFSGYMGSCQDITESLQIEEEAQEKNRQLHEMLQNVRLIAVILNLEGKVTFCNGYLLELTGWKLEEVIGCDWFEKFIPDGEPIRSFFKKSIAKHSIQPHYENDILTKDGRRLNIAWNNTLLRDPKGNPLGTTSIGEDITEKRRALEAVKENQRVLSTLLSNLVGMAYRCRVDEFWTMEFVSEGCRTLTGYSPEELLSNKRISYEAITHPDDRERVRREIYESLDCGKQFDLEYRIITAQGIERWVWERGVGIASADGKTMVLEGFIADITQKRRYEEELHRIQMAVENATDCIGITEPTGKALFHNRAFREKIGLSINDVNEHGGPKSIFASREKHDEIHSALLNGQVWSGDVQIINSEQNVCDYHLRANPIVDANGKILALMGVFTDQSERIRAQRLISEQAALLDSAQDAIIIRDLDSVITYWNRGATHLYGWTKEEAIGRSAMELLYRGDAVYLKTIQILLKEGEWSGEMHHHTKSGREVTVESRWTLFRDDRDQPRSILTINTDVTEKKRLEAQFLRAQRMESIGTLAGGIAHDLNNVLAPIVMSIDLLKPSAQSEYEREILEQIDASAKRGADLVKQVLSFARGVGGRRIGINVDKLLKDVVKIAKETFPRSIEIKYQSTNDVSTITGDPTQLNQVLLNLCVNARDALPHGGTITIISQNAAISETTAEKIQGRSGNYVQITVADNGIGIPEEIQGRIFEPFFTTKEIGKGTGLGLSTVMAIVRSHGGFILVESQIGKGASFHVYLPCSEAKEQETSIEAKTEVPRGSGELILIVEDEPPVRNLLKAILEGHGYKVVSAENGAKGLSTYSQYSQEIKAVITDMMMPVMDGTALIQSLRKVTPDLPIIAISGLYETLSVEKATVAGANRYVPKPFTVESILHSLDSILKSA